MEYRRDMKEFKKQSKRIIESLVNEAKTGTTKMDTLDNVGRSLWCPEAEAMYFKAVRNFFETSVSRRVMNRNQDTAEIRVMKKVRNINHHSCTNTK